MTKTVKVSFAEISSSLINLKFDYSLPNIDVDAFLERCIEALEYENNEEHVIESLTLLAGEIAYSGPMHDTVHFVYECILEEASKITKAIELKLKNYGLYKNGILNYEYKFKSESNEIFFTSKQKK